MKTTKMTMTKKTTKKTNEPVEFSVDLPKWPALLVVGKRVTRDQAAEILIRTDSWYFSSNDQEWDKLLLETVGVEYTEDRHYPYDVMDKVRARYGQLDLSYLVNSQIVSSWIGGPYGWCHWDGRIFANSFNIGKWPSVKAVLADWKTIAAAFPFLNLKSQLLDQEHGDEGKPLVEFTVSEGTATAGPPGDQLIDSDGESSISTFMRTCGSPFRERGCDIEVFKAALEITLSRKSI